MINDEESVHTQPFSRIKQALSSGIGCNTGWYLQLCYFLHRKWGQSYTVFVCVYQPLAEDHAILLTHYTFTLQGKCYAFSGETESRFVFIDYSFLYFYL